MAEVDALPTFGTELKVGFLSCLQMLALDEQSFPGCL
jgi:hypothetical protein